MTTLDARAPLVFDTRALRRRAGVMEDVSCTVTLGQDVGTDVIAIPAGEPIDLDVRLESVVEGVLASGTVRSIARGTCVRCLEGVEFAVEAPLQELYVYPDRAVHSVEVGDDEDEQHVLDGDLLDLEPALVDAVVPTLPFQPVCRPDCPGLCPQCGVRLADEPGHAHDDIDPRWAALAGLAPEATGEPGGQRPTEEKKR